MTQKNKNRLATTIRYALMILLGAIFFFPLLFMVISSFKPGLQILQDSSSLRAFLPVGDLSLQNYFDAFDRVLVLSSCTRLPQGSAGAPTSSPGRSAVRLWSRGE